MTGRRSISVRCVVLGNMANLDAEHGRNADNLTHFFRMADRTLHRAAAAHAVTDAVRAWDFEIIEQRSHIEGAARSGSA